MIDMEDILGQLNQKKIFDDINNKFFENKLSQNWEGLTYDEVKKTISDNFQRV